MHIPQIKTMARRDTAAAADEAVGVVGDGESGGGGGVHFGLVAVPVVAVEVSGEGHAFGVGVQSLGDHGAGYVGGVEIVG